MHGRIASAVAFAPIVALSVALAIVLANQSPATPPTVGAGVELTPSPSPAYSQDPTAGPSAVSLPGTGGVPSPTASATWSDIQGLRVSVPRLSIDLPLEPGDAVRDVPRPGFAGATPENVALVFPGSRPPGGGGNTYIYAHARSGMFLSLWNAAIGDRILITDTRTSAQLVYRVGVIAPRVDPSDSHWLDPTGVERLTLQTSTGPLPSDPRFIVVAYPEGQAKTAP